MLQSKTKQNKKNRDSESMSYSNNVAGLFQITKIKIHNLYELGKPNHLNVYGGNHLLGFLWVASLFLELKNNLVHPV